MSDPAADAIARAKEIAARLAGGNSASTVAHSVGGGTAANPAPPSDPAAVAEAALAAAFGNNGAASSTASNGGEKKRRWGGDTASSSADDAVAAAMSIMDNSGKRTKTDVTKKIWIPSDQNPGYNYIGLLIGPGGSKQRELINQAGGNVKLSIRGRGSSSPGSANVPNGSGEEPLHVLLEGSQECVDRAETLVNELLHDSAKANAEKDRQLAEFNANKTPISSYQPKPVAQLLGLGASSNSFGPPSGVDTIEEKIGVPNGVVGYIIGKGGESITSMQRRSSCRVQIQKEYEMDPGSTQRIITLTAATPESIAQCRAIIEGMVQERLRLNQEQSAGGGYHSHHRSSTVGGGSNAAAQAANLQQALAEGQALVKVQVPNADVGLIIGKGGTTIRSIQDRSGANVQIPQGPDADNPAIRTISVTHPQKEGAEFAKTLVEEVLQSKASFQSSNSNYNSGGSSHKPNPGDISMQIQIPDKDVGMCIGRGGCVIREMQGKTSTRIQIPSMPTPGQLYRIATITGPADGCQKVAEIIARISSEQSSQFVITGAAFQSYGGTAYGQPQQQQSHYGQQAGAGQYGQQTTYGQQQQYSAYTNTAANSYGQQQGANTSNAGKTDYSAEWAAYYAAQAASAGTSTATTTATQATAATTPAAATTTTAAPTDSSASQPAADTYHDAFFRYAYHYGDEAARQYYGAWSPAPGTPNPYGTNPNITAAPATTAAAPLAAATTAVASVDTTASNPNIKDSSVRNVSNLPAWMTKN